MARSILAFAVIFVVSFFLCCPGLASDADSFAGAIVGRWREHKPDLTLAVRTSSYVAADGVRGYNDLAASAVVVERLANERFTHYSATPLSIFFNSSIPDGAAFQINKDLTSSFSYVRNNRSQKIVAGAGDDSTFAIVNEYVDTLPRLDNPARGKWRDSVVPVAAASPYFTDPFAVDFQCRERVIGGIPYLLGEYSTDVFEQKLPGGHVFSGRITGVGLERGGKDKAPMVAMRVMGVIRDADGNREGVVNLQSYSIRQGDDIAAIQTLVQDEGFAMALAENLLVPKPEYLSSAALLASRPAMEALPAAPEWIDALWEAVEARTSCILVQLEMRTNSLWGDALVSVGKGVKKATQNLRAAVDKLPVAEMLKLPLKVLNLTVDTLLGPCIEATGHLINGDRDAADATINQAYFGGGDDPGFYRELTTAIVGEVGSVIIGVAGSDPSMLDWPAPLIEIVDKVWDMTLDRVTSRPPQIAPQPAPPPPGSPYNATSGQLEDPATWEEDPDVPVQPEAPSPPPIQSVPAAAPAPPPAPEPPSPAPQSIGASLREGMEWVWMRTGAGDEGMYIVAFDKYVDELFIMKLEPSYLMGWNPGPTKGSARMIREGDAWTFTAVWGNDRARYELRRAGADEYIGQSGGGTSKWARVKTIEGVGMVTGIEYNLLASEIIRHRAMHREDYARVHGTEADRAKRKRETAEAAATMERYLREANK